MLILVLEALFDIHLASLLLHMCHASSHHFIDGNIQEHWADQT